MARPKTKEDLLHRSDDEFNKLLNYVGALSPQERKAEFPEGFMNRNIGDVLMHLHHWHLMLLEWYDLGMAGQKPEMPAPGYSWKATPQLNKWIWEQYRDVDLQDAIRNLRDSHHKVMELIKSHSDEELFEKKRYRWTRSTSLGAYFISATCSHYEWALKLIRRAVRR